MSEGKERKIHVETTDKKGGNNMTPPIERYCTVEESIIESMKEVRLMREGKLPKRNWRDAFKEIKEELKDDL